MSGAAHFIIDLKKSFPHLRAAPIVEAVIHWRARGMKKWQAEDLRKELVQRLPEYSKAAIIHQMVFEAQVQVGSEIPQPVTNRVTGSHGVRMQSHDDPYIARFTRDGFVFSRLQPYEDWERFSAEARRLWNIFVELLAPSEIQRLGVRFINRIHAAAVDNLDEFLKDPPSFASDLQLNSFLYQSTFLVPGHPFGIRIVKTIPARKTKTADSGLIIDIDVSSNGPLPCEDKVLDEYLPQMRWLKNNVFFHLLTKKAINKFK